MNKNEIIEKLDGLYGSYIDRKNKLYEGEKKEAVRLLKELSRIGEMEDIALQLARFPGDVTGAYFEGVIKLEFFNTETIDELLQALDTECDKAKDKQHNVIKYVNAVSAILRNSSLELSGSALLPKYVGFIAGYAEKSEKNLNRFQSLITGTKGKIYLLDHSKAEKKSVESIWNATRKIYPDLSAAPFSEQITAWADKNGFAVQSELPAEPSENKVQPRDTADDKNKTQEVPQQTAAQKPEKPARHENETKKAVSGKKTGAPLSAKEKAPCGITAEQAAEMTAEKLTAALTKES